MKKEKKTRKKEPERPQYVENPLRNMVMDYHVYEMSRLEKVLYSIAALLGGGVLGLVFYGGLFMMDGEATTLTHISNLVVFLGMGAVAVRVFLPIRTQQLLKKRQQTLRVQFRDMLESITSSLSANDTVVQAFTYAYKDMCMQYSENAYIARELYEIGEGIRNNVGLEVMIQDFARRSACEDIESFSNVFAVSYGPGGRMKDVMRQTHDIICEKMQIADEIRSKLSSNQLELNLITAAPVLLVGMMRLSSRSFAENFASLPGVLAITAGLALFVLAYRMGQKIIDIKE